MSLTTNSIMLSKLAGIDAAEATKDLTSAVNGYKQAGVEASAVVDKLVQVDNVSASSAADLATAMSETAVTAQQAGISIDKLLGYLGTMEEVTQDSGESVGNSMKTILSRMTQVKNSALEDGTALNDVEKSLKNVGVSLTDESGQFRNVGDVLDELAGKWNSLSSVEKGNISTTISGVRQKEKFLVLMANYSRAMELSEKSADSSGLAQDRYGAYLESVAGKQKQMTAASEKFIDTFLNSKAIGLIYTAAKYLLDLATAIDKVTGGFAGWVAVIGTFGVAINAMTKGWLVDMIVKLPEISAAMTAFSTATAGGASSLVAFGTAMASSGLLATAGVVAGVVALIAIIDKLTVSFTEQKDKVQSLASEIDSLTQKKSDLEQKDNKTEDEQQYLDVLSAEIEIKKQDYEIEKKKEYQLELNSKKNGYQRTFGGTPTSLTQASGLSSDVKDLADAYKAVNDAYTKFQDAAKSGNEEEMKSAAEAYQTEKDKRDAIQQKYETLTEEISSYGDVANDTDKATLKNYQDIITSLTEVGDASSSTYDDIESEINRAQDDYDNFDKTIKTFSSSLSDLTNVYKEMSDDGQLSADTVLNLLENNSDLLQYLTLEDGQYKISQESMQAYFEMKKQGTLDEITETEATTQAAIDDANSQIQANNAKIESNNLVIDSLQKVANAMGVLGGLVSSQLTSLKNANSDLTEKNVGLGKSVNDLQGNLTNLKSRYEKVAGMTYNFAIAQTAAGGATKAATSAAKEQEEALKKVQEAAQDYLDTLNDEKDKQDAIAKAIQKIIQKEIDALNDQKDALDDTYDARIDALKEQETALEDQENTEDKLLEIEKARTELQKAQSQRNVRRYEEGKGWVWTSDASTVSSAQEKLDDLEKSWKREQEKAAIESTIKALEAEKKAAEDNISAQIKTLQKLKDGWNEATDTTMTNLNKWTGALEYVTQFENGNYNTRISMMNSFTSNYIGLCNQIINAEKAVAQAKANAEAASNVSYSGGSYSGGGSSSGGSSTPVAAHIVSKRYTSWLYNGSHRDASGRTTYTYLRHVYYTWSDGHQSTSTETRISTVRLTASQMSASYASGGVDTKGGEAILHGTPNHAEVIFNAAQGKALYNWVNNLANAERAGTINSTTNSKQSSIVINRLEVTAPNNATIDTIITSARQKIQTTR